VAADLDFSAPAIIAPPVDESNPEAEWIDPEASEEIPDGPSCGTCGKVIIREPGKRGRMPKYHPECRPSAKKTTRRKTTKKQVGVPDYEEGLNAVFQMVSWGLTMAGDRNEMVLADGLAVAEHGPNIAGALNQLAQEKPEVAAVLDKVLAAGPYGLVVAAVSPLIMQISANHGVKVPGMKDAKSYVRQFVPQRPENAAA